MSSTPVFAATPRCAIGQVTAANTNRDGTGTIATICTAGSSGSRIDRIDVKAVGTTTAGMVRLYIHDGTNARLWKEVAVTAATPSGTIPAFATKPMDVAQNGDTPLILPNGYSLRASTHNAETFNVIAIGGDF